MENQEQKAGELYIVSVPIGNKDDISKRGAWAIKTSDFVVCEEMKQGAKILKELNLRKDMIDLNVKNESERTPELIKMLLDGKKLALISDAGTPVFADPGLQLVRAAIKREIPIHVLPGPVSIMAALVRSGFSIEEFLYAGFLPRLSADRKRKIGDLSREPRTVAVLEAPYRLLPLLADFAYVIPDRQAYIGMNLTMPYESHHYGTFRELNDKFKDEQVKAEFVICFEGSPKIDRPFRKFDGPKKDKYPPKYKSDFQKKPDNKFRKKDR
jgi:16S rRNA (cytidine1402-2'-O)-methyltransferase